MGIDINDPDFIDKLKSELKKGFSERDQILTKIQPWLTSIQESELSKIEKKQKHKETIDLGTFLFHLDKEIQIKEVFTESPDFIVSDNARKIGIELKDLVIQKEEKEKESILKSIFIEIEKELEEENQIENCGFYRIEFIEENIPLRQKDRIKIRKEILSKIKGLPTKTNYVRNIIKRKDAKITHVYKGEPHIVGHLKRKMVEDNIDSKDRKFSNYNKKKFDEIWLLLVIGGIEKSSDYSFIEESILNKEFISNFKRVFLYDFSSTEIIELKVTAHNNG